MTQANLVTDKETITQKADWRELYREVQISLKTVSRNLFSVVNSSIIQDQSSLWCRPCWPKLFTSTLNAHYLFSRWSKAWPITRVNVFKSSYTRDVMWQHVVPPSWNVPSSFCFIILVLVDKNERKRKRKRRHEWFRVKKMEKETTKEEGEAEKARQEEEEREESNGKGSSTWASASAWQRFFQRSSRESPESQEKRFERM